MMKKLFLFYLLITTSFSAIAMDTQLDKLRRELKNCLGYCRTQLGYCDTHHDRHAHAVKVESCAQDCRINYLAQVMVLTQQQNLKKDYPKSKGGAF